MARASTVIQAAIDALRAALQEGVVSVSYEGRAVTYRSAAEMRGILRDLEDELLEAEGGKRGGLRYAEFRSGY